MQPCSPLPLPWSILTFQINLPLIASLYRVWGEWASWPNLRCYCASKRASLPKEGCVNIDRAINYCLTKRRRMLEVNDLSCIWLWLYFERNWRTWPAFDRYIEGLLDCTLGTSSANPKGPCIHGYKMPKSIDYIEKNLIQLGPNLYNQSQWRTLRVLVNK